MLRFSEYVYLERLDSEYTFYWMTKFSESIRSAQFVLFPFFAALDVG